VPGFSVAIDFPRSIVFLQNENESQTSSGKVHTNVRHAMAQSAAQSTTYNRFWDCQTSANTWKRKDDWT
jgi:hypothetical protein